MSRAYGSLQNILLDRTSGLLPVVGMGATEISYTDRYPYEIIEVKDDRHITVRALDYKRIDDFGFSESQEYEYSSNEDNATKDLFFTKQGKWRERIGRGLGSAFFIGRAEKYYDFTF